MLAVGVIAAVAVWPAYRVQQLLRLEGIVGTVLHIVLRGEDTVYSSQFVDRIADFYLD